MGEMVVQAEGDSVKRALIRALPSIPTPALEDVLIDLLEHERFAPYAARYLGQSGSWTARRQLRDLAAVGSKRRGQPTEVEPV